MQKQLKDGNEPATLVITRSPGGVYVGELLLPDGRWAYCERRRSLHALLGHYRRADYGVGISEVDASALGRTEQDIIERYETKGES